MDKTWIAALSTVSVGAFIALQAPINSVLGRSVGTFAAASVSFAIGTALLLAITVTVGGGFGDLGEIANISPVYLIGGMLGAAYVTVVLVTVRTLGAGGVTAATIAGQLTCSVLLDRAGAFGLTERPVSLARMVGILLLAAGVFLVVRE